MFETSLLESSGRLCSRPGWTTAASLALQSLALGLFVLIPLLHTEGLPPMRVVMAPVPMPRGKPARVPPGSESRRPAPILQSAATLMAPTSIPPTIAQDPHDGPPGPPQVGNLSGGCSACSPDGVLHSVGEAMRFVPQSEAPAPPQRMVISAGVTAGQLIHRVQPVYPRIAVLAGIEGTVVLHAIISKSGAIESLRVVSGPLVLQPAAVDAVRQWRYRPFLLGSVPVEVETQVTVNFVLTRNR